MILAIAILFLGRPLYSVRMLACHLAISFPPIEGEFKGQEIEVSYKRNPGARADTLGQLCCGNRYGFRTDGASFDTAMDMSRKESVQFVFHLNGTRGR